jgi:hypothetical protein
VQTYQPESLTRALAAEKIAATAMNIRVQLRFRATMSALTGIALLLLSVKAEFFRSGFDAFRTLVSFFIALFGVAFLLQCWRLIRQLKEVPSKLPAEAVQEIPHEATPSFQKDA